MKAKLGMNRNYVNEDISKVKYIVGQDTGLYRKEFEHDACGIGMIVNINGNKSHELVDSALTVLENMTKQETEPEFWFRFLMSLSCFREFLFQKKGLMVQALFFSQKTRMSRKV